MASSPNDAVLSSPPPEPATLLDAIASGVAVVAPRCWSVLVANARFNSWFPAVAGEGSLTARVPELDIALATREISARDRHSFAVERRLAGRAIGFEVALSMMSGGNLLVEVRDDSRRRRTELMLDSYSRLAEKSLRELQQEKARAERLLLNLMPRAVLQEMREFGTVSPQRFDGATALMLDFVDFSEMAVARDPAALVAELNDIFSALDRISEMFGCERIKTNGDSYMAVCGLPERNSDHAASVAHAALRMRGYIDRRNRANSNQWRCRIGIASGPVVGSIVGVNKYVYDVFGPAVNLAARLERIAAPMQIMLAKETAALLGGAFTCLPRAVCHLKGFGAHQVYELLGGGGVEGRQGSGLALLPDPTAAPGS
ncbi:MAG: adenylate/guanylate cyclase domain-containing protein [Alphaproteobacteria bacterium]|nr:adenylate/guanylate cyclase domain-containing protein [Alphaproteobacteria bacterium]